MKIKEHIKKVYDIKLIRFIFVSGINTAFGYGLFASLIFIGLHYSLAIFLSTVLGVLFNFKTMGIIVFNNKSNRLIFKFFGVYGITYICGTAGIALFKFFGLNEYIGGALILLPMGLLAYFLNHYFVFNKKVNEE
ncbi:MAG: GtrA family protein [Bacteroidales bacterium]